MLVLEGARVVLLVVSEHGVFESEAATADGAREGSLASVGPHVPAEVLCRPEPAEAEGAHDLDRQSHEAGEDRIERRATSLFLLPSGWCNLRAASSRPRHLRRSTRGHPWRGEPRTRAHASVASVPAPRLALRSNSRRGGI